MRLMLDYDHSCDPLYFAAAFGCLLIQIHCEILHYFFSVMFIVSKAYNV